MADRPFYTKKRNAQWRGPTTSEDYNARIEENYNDLTIQTNQIEVLKDNLDFVRRTLIKASINGVDRISAKLEELNTMGALNDCFFQGINLFEDNDRFDSTEFAIDPNNRLRYDPSYRVFTLPRIDSGSFSKLKFVSRDGQEIISPNFKVYIEPIGDVEAREENFIDANDFYNCIISDFTRRGWEVNSVVDSSYSGVSAFRVYVSIPDDMSLVRESNTMLFNPLFSGSCDLSDVQYTTQRNVTFSPSDNWQDFNVPKFPLSIDNRWVLPDDGEDINECLGTLFSFPPLPVTAVAFTLSTSSKLVDDNNVNVYSNGLHKFDIRYEKYLGEGQAMLRIESDGDAISSVDSVTPILANCSSSEAPSSFSFEPVWETSEDSGIYTLDPVPGSSKVWLRVTLRKTINGGAPTMPFLIVEKS